MRRRLHPALYHVTYGCALAGPRRPMNDVEPAVQRLDSSPLPFVDGHHICSMCRPKVDSSLGAGLARAAPGRQPCTESM
jgi:hypothetical protein